MYFVKYILVLVVILVDSDAGGHGAKQHDHVKLHIPKFIHHDRHTKVITIHHHHHKPKKEHHHHHHHHPKPQIPQIPHQHTHHHTKISTHTVSKGQSNRHRHKNLHGHYGHHSHHGHEHKHHDPSSSHDPPSINYDPPSVNYIPSVNYHPSTTYGGNHDSFLPSISNIPSSPHVHGVVHTVKQVKVFDSLPGTLQGGKTGKTGSQGYEVTEQGDEDEEDVFTSVNSLSQSYPGTYGFVRSAAAESDGTPFAEISQQSIQSPNHDPFAGAQPQQSFANLEDFTIQTKQLTSSPPLPGVKSPQFSSDAEYDDHGNPTTGNEGNNFRLLVTEDDDTPVSFTREAGIQHLINTEGIETVAY